MNRVLTGDCLESTGGLAPGTVDLILTSPPYAQKRKKTYEGVRPEDYVDWFLPRAAEFRRVLAPRGSFVLNIKEGTDGTERQTYVLELVLALRKQGWLWIDDLIWHKKNPFPSSSPRRLMDAWEHLHHFTLHRDPWMDQQAVRVPAAKSTLAKKRREAERGDPLITSGSGSGMTYTLKNAAKGGLVRPNNVLHLTTENGNQGHSAAFPVQLPTFFIRLFCPPGGLVYDPFCGSGTTLVAAKREGRNGLGTELSKDYADRARQRIRDA